MEITAYNLHWRLLSLRVLVLRKNSSLLGDREEPSLLSNQADVVREGSRAYNENSLLGLRDIDPKKFGWRSASSAAITALK
jgi:hypothetical protein